PRMKTELDVLREHHRFLRSDEDDSDTSWEARVAKKYYDKLFREYTLAEMSRFKEGRIAMRWRSQRELVDGKGE
ncbi:folate-sensitive fragile site protein Fra10Ac1, partial [Blyttiomyces helicus]